jgi:hypothetical protein
MKKFSIWAVGLTFLGIVVFLGAQVTVPTYLDVSPSKVVKTYANSQVDTVTWTREYGVSALAFGVHAKDSVYITTVQVQRGVDGAYWRHYGTVAQDTIAELENFRNLANKTDPDSACVGVVQLYPIADSYQFIVTYNSTGNGVTNNKVVYEVIKQYSRR